MKRLTREEEKQRRRGKEEILNTKTEWNISDPTPYQAVKNIIGIK